jgi:phage shock protein B
MQGAFIVAIVFGGVVLSLAVIGATVLGAMKIVRGGGRRDREADAEEARMIQELYRALPRLEERIDALETIIMDKKDRSGKDRKEGTG